jgi:uncharacterized protein
MSNSGLPRTPRTPRTARTARRRGRAATVAALAGATVLLTAVPAFAHVTVRPATAVKGGYGTVDFKVPNEQDGASTIKIEVNLPMDHPFASVSLQPVPGWTGKLTTSKLSTPIRTHSGMTDQAVSKITWSGGKIAPGQFQQFPVSFGPLPEDEDTLVFKTLQTYDNGDVVRWIEAPKEGQAEPDNPAPTLKLTAPEEVTGTVTATGAPAPANEAKGTGGTSQTGSNASAGSTASSVSSASTASTGSSDATARALGIAGIAVGALGVGFGVFAGRRRDPAGTSDRTSDRTPSGTPGGAAGPSA